MDLHTWVASGKRLLDYPMFGKPLGEYAGAELEALATRCRMEAEQHLASRRVSNQGTTAQRLMTLASIDSG